MERNSLVSREAKDRVLKELKAEAEVLAKYHRSSRAERAENVPPVTGKPPSNEVHTLQLERQQLLEWGENLYRQVARLEKENQDANKYIQQERNRTQHLDDVNRDLLDKVLTLENGDGNTGIRSNAETVDLRKQIGLYKRELEHVKREKDIAARAVTEMRDELHVLKAECSSYSLSREELARDFAQLQARYDEVRTLCDVTTDRRKSYEQRAHESKIELEAVHGALRRTKAAADSMRAEVSEARAQRLASERRAQELAEIIRPLQELFRETQFAFAAQTREFERFVTDVVRTRKNAWLSMHKAREAMIVAEEFSAAALEHRADYDLPQSVTQPQQRDDNSARLEQPTEAWGNLTAEAREAKERELVEARLLEQKELEDSVRDTPSNRSFQRLHGEGAYSSPRPDEFVSPRDEFVSPRVPTESSRGRGRDDDSRSASLDFSPPPRTDSEEMSVYESPPRSPKAKVTAAEESVGNLASRPVAEIANLKKKGFVLGEVHEGKGKAKDKLVKLKCALSKDEKTINMKSGGCMGGKHAPLHLCDILRLQYGTGSRSFQLAQRLDKDIMGKFCFTVEYSGTNGVETVHLYIPDSSQADKVLKELLLAMSHLISPNARGFFLSRGAFYAAKLRAVVDDMASYRGMTRYMFWRLLLAQDRPKRAPPLDPEAAKDPRVILRRR